MRAPPDERHVSTAQVPVSLAVPAAMREAVAEVLAGEYEAGYFGEGLTILDIGANVGAFSLWANLRWPGSTLHAFEPHPGTFRYLRQNLGGLSNVVLHNMAVFPTEQKRLSFFTRYDGDGESGLAQCMTRTFVSDLPGAQTLTVDVIHPASLPAADVVKLDVEGAEAEILEHLPLERTELVLLEYQDDANRVAVKRRLGREFVLVYEDAVPWDDLLDYGGYRPELAGDHYGRLFFARRECRRLRRLAPPGITRAAVEAAGAVTAPPPPHSWRARWIDALRRWRG